MESIKTTESQWVKLNVGGIKFNTTMNTLLKGDTMLSKMFSSPLHKTRDENGYILIDRDGKHFSKILNYLRNGVIPSLKDEAEAKELFQESDFYCIEGLKNHCLEFRLSKKVLVYACDQFERCAYKSNAIQNLFFNKYVGEPCNIPILSDGTMSLTQLKIEYKRQLEAGGHYISCQCLSKTCYDWGFERFCAHILSNLGVSVIYWSDYDGMPTETNLTIQDQKVLPPDFGWIERPAWAYDGPFYYMSRRNPQS